MVDVLLEPGFTDVDGSSDAGKRDSLEQQAVYEGSRFVADGLVGGVLGELPAAVSAAVVLLAVAGEAVLDGVGGVAGWAGWHEFDFTTSSLPVKHYPQSGPPAQVIENVL